MQNPLKDPNKPVKIPDPCTVVIFGATGDLTGRKLAPALYNLGLDQMLPANFAMVGFARRDKKDEDFRGEVKENLNQFSRNKPVNEDFWKSFQEKIFYHKSEFDDDNGYESLKSRLEEIDAKLGTRGNRIFYLSVQPKFFPTIVKKLNEHGLIYDSQDESKWSKVIIEKPFGHDVESAANLQKDISQHLAESQIYRIDHYLGKETVQNLLVFRFANSIFESLWNNRFIDHIQITMAESIGIGTRGKFFEEEGFLRDILQNHIMQLLSLVAMEPPVNLEANSIRDEKVKVLKAIRPFTQEDFEKNIIRGQYGKGVVDGQDVKPYREEENVAGDSKIETYVALKLFIDNWRWANVPFYLRGGKRLPKRATEIAICFKDAPGVLFQQGGHKHDPNMIVIRIQPDEGISLKVNCKVPGPNSPIQPVKMDFRYSSYFGQEPPEAYERLIWDCMQGDNTLFARCDEVERSWAIYTPLLKYWESQKAEDFPNYESGSWGPEKAEELIKNDQRSWRIL